MNHVKTEGIFAFGLLMIPKVMKDVTGIELLGTEAVLSGFRRVSLAGRNYPGITRDDHGGVRGIYYADTDADMIRRIDAFEGDEYRRDIVSIRLASGEVCSAGVYLMSKTGEALVTNESWDLEAYKREHLQDFLNGVVDR